MEKMLADIFLIRKRILKKSVEKVYMCLLARACDVKERKRWRGIHKIQSARCPEGITLWTLSRPMLS